MTLEIIRNNLPREVVEIKYAEYNSQGGGSIPLGDVPVRSLEPFEDTLKSDGFWPTSCKIERYFDIQNITRFAPDYFVPRLQGTLVGQNGTADFILYF